MKKEITNANELRLKHLMIDTCPEFVEWASKNLYVGLKEDKNLLFEDFKEKSSNKYIKNSMTKNILTRWINKYCEYNGYDFDSNIGTACRFLHIKGYVENFGEIVSISKEMSCLLCKHYQEPRFSIVCSLCIKNNKVNEYYK